MLVQLMIATAMVTAMAFIHLVGLALLTRALKSHSRALRRLRIMPLTLLLAATIGIIGIHTIEIWLYAALYLGVGAFSHLRMPKEVRAHRGSASIRTGKAHLRSSGNSRGNMCVVQRLCARQAAFAQG